MIKLKIALLVVLAAAIAAAGAGWKWRGNSAPKSQGEYQIAGWTWDEQAESVTESY